MRLTIPRLVLLILLELLVILIAKVVLSAQEPPGGYGPQVVLTILKTEGEKKWVVPEAVTWFRLAPLSGPTAKAPLARGDYLICHTFDMRDREGGLHVAIKCGEDAYLIEAFGLKPPEEKKK